MAISPTDFTHLMLPLFEGIFEDPLWETFLERLMLRTGAQRVRLMVRNSAAPSQTPLIRRVASRLEPSNLAEAEITALAALPYATLRPNRVYALEELRDFDNASARATQDKALQTARIGDARLIRVAGRGDLHAWLLLLHERSSFGAADSALLTALAPAIATAMATLASIGEVRLRAEAAETTLAMLGIGQAVLDRDGHMLVADSLAQSHLPLPYASAAQHGSGIPAMAQACSALAEASLDQRVAVKIDERGVGNVLLRPVKRKIGSLPHPAVAVGSFRLSQREAPVGSALVIAQTLGLSLRESALAEAMSRGRSIIEAGTQLRLTPETARNYSKRIYAKTGTSGQADLVRLVLTGLAPLA